MNKKWLAMPLAWLMAVSLCACAEKTAERPEEASSPAPTEATTPTPVPTPSMTAGPTTSVHVGEDGALLMAFLRGESEAVVDEAFCDDTYDSGLADMDTFTLQELSHRINENTESAGDLTYAMLETLGGREMLVLHYMPGAAMDTHMYLVFGVFDGQVRLTYATAFGYRSYTELCQGLVFSGSGSSGAGDHPYWDGYIDETGHYQSLYRNGEDLSGGWAIGYAQIDEELYDESCELILLEMDGTRYYQLGQWSEEEGPLDPALLAQMREYLDGQGMTETDSIDDLIADAYVARGFPAKPEPYAGPWLSLELDQQKN